MKRGQAAMEFLMTYGWAILVVLIAIGALAYFGVLNPNRFLPSSCTIIPGISCDDHLATFATGTIQLLMRNGLGEDLTSLTVAITGCTASAEADGDDSWTDGDVLGGADGITLSGCTTAVIPSQGGRVKTDITITYTGASGLTKTATGSLNTEAA